MIKRRSWRDAVGRLLQYWGLHELPVLPPPTEYQKHVAKKAQEFLKLIQTSELCDRFQPLQAFLNEIIACRVPLPNQKLYGWSWYFIYENPERLDLKYPEIMHMHIHLTHLMEYGSFEKLEAGERRLKNLTKGASS